MSGGASRRYPPELRERAVRIAAEISDQHDSEWAVICGVARLLGVGTAQTVGKWLRQAQVDSLARPGTTTEESAELKRRGRMPNCAGRQSKSQARLRQHFRNHRRRALVAEER
jgi:transposase